MEVIRFAGDCAVQINFDKDIFPSAAFHLKKQLVGIPIEDVVSTYRAITVYFDPLKISPEKVRERLAAIKFNAGTEPTGVIHTIKMCVCSECAPDAAFAAEKSGMKFEKFIEKYCSAEYSVRFLGFQPGFPFCDGLPAELALPRLETPRIRVPEGSVGIGGVQTGIYVFPTPGGWRLIGRTKFRLFDVQKGAVLKPGDRIRFYVETH